MFDRSRQLLAVGVDAVEPARLQRRLLNNPRLERELFTAAELAYSYGQPNSIQHLAARFSAKEAVVKALALDGFEPLEIEVVSPMPAPAVRLSGDAEAHATRLGVHIILSLTHLQSVAIAVAVAVPRRRPGLLERLRRSSPR